jgi:hypothetical protein
MATATDERRHATGEGIDWSESYFFTFHDAANDMAGFFRVGMQANRQSSNMWCHIMRGGKTLYHCVRPHQPYTDAGIDDIAVGGLRLKMEEPLKFFNIQFRDRQLSIDLFWSGYHDVFDFRDALRGLSSSVATGHYEQYGEVRGTVDVDGERTDIHGYGFRDHSWGVRDWEAVKHWQAFTATFGNEFAFSGVRVLDHSGSIKCMGLVFDGTDNVFIHTVNAEVNDLSAPLHGSVELIDERNRVFNADVEFTLAPEIPHDFNIIHECYAKYSMDGRIGYGTYEINRRYQGAT